MIKVYLDTNIYSYFREDRNDHNHAINRHAKRLKNLLIERKDKFLCFYSEAHIFDLKKDKSENENWKHELEEIKNIAFENFLTREHQSHQTSHHLVAPEKIFPEYSNPEDLGELIKLSQLNDLPEIERKKVDQLLDIQLPFDLIESSGHKELDDLILLLFGERKESYTIRDILNQAPIFLNQLFSNPKSFQGMRKMMIDFLQLKEKWRLSLQEEDFMGKLKFTPLGKDFFEFIEGSITKKKEEPGYDYDFFTSSYSMLNALGIDNEKNRKVKFHSMFLDGLHSYYGAHCHVVISEDQGFLSKSKVLYEKFKLGTKITTIEEFLKIYENQEDFSFIDPTDFLNQIVEFSKNEEFIGDYGLENGQKTIEYGISPWLFNYFNRIEFSEHEEFGKFLALTQKVNLWFRMTSWREYENVINHLISILGIDDQKKGEFSEIEKEEINTGIWEGRLWSFDQLTASLVINKVNGILTFVILL